jgi:hypothetical protein
VDWNKTPKDSFTMSDGKDITFLEYYRWKGEMGEGPVDGVVCPLSFSREYWAPLQHTTWHFKNNYIGNMSSIWMASFVGFDLNVLPSQLQFFWYFGKLLLNLCQGFEVLFFFFF